MYNITLARLCYHCCSGKTISITYSESVFEALVVQHAMRLRHIVFLLPAWLYNIFPLYLKKTRFF